MVYASQVRFAAKSKPAVDVEGCQLATNASIIWQACQSDSRVSSIKRCDAVAVRGGVRSVQIGGCTKARRA